MSFCNDGVELNILPTVSPFHTYSAVGANHTLSPLRKFLLVLQKAIIQLLLEFHNILIPFGNTCKSKLNSSPSRKLG